MSSHAGHFPSFSPYLRQGPHFYCVFLYFLCRCSLHQAVHPEEKTVSSPFSDEKNRKNSFPVKKTFSSLIEYPLLTLSCCNYSLGMSWVLYLSGSRDIKVSTLPSKKGFGCIFFFFFPNLSCSNGSDVHPPDSPFHLIHTLQATDAPKIHLTLIATRVILQNGLIFRLSLQYVV